MAASICAAEHAHLAVGVGQSGGPLHRVVAIVGLVLEGVPLALGGVPTAHILHHHHVAARNRLPGKVRGAILVIGRSLQKHGEVSLAGRPVDVGPERYAVARLHSDIALHLNARNSWSGRLTTGINARQQHGGK
jgi:hypothetical protein